MKTLVILGLLSAAILVSGMWLPKQQARASVSIVKDVKTLVPTSNGTDVSYPLGVWGAWHEMPGDESGGVVDIVFNLGREFLFSVEDICLKSPTGAGNVRVEWLPGVYYGSGPHHFGSIPVIENIAMGHTQWSIGRDAVAYERMMIGGLTQQMEPQVQVIWGANSTAGSGVYAANIWGYYWDRKALNTPTGPRRP